MTQTTQRATTKDDNEKPRAGSKADTKATKEGALPEHHMVEQQEANPPPPSNPDSWQGSEIASAIRGYEEQPPPEVLDGYADNSKEQIEARKKGEELTKKRDAEDAERLKKQEDEAEAKRQRR